MSSIITKRQPLQCECSTCKMSEISNQEKLNMHTYDYYYHYASDCLEYLNCLKKKTTPNSQQILQQITQMQGTGASAQMRLDELLETFIKHYSRFVAKDTFDLGLQNTFYSTHKKVQTALRERNLQVAPDRVMPIVVQAYKCKRNYMFNKRKIDQRKGENELLSLKNKQYARRLETAEKTHSQFFRKFHSSPEERSNTAQISNGASLKGSRKGSETPMLWGSNSEIVRQKATLPNPVLAGIHGERMPCTKGQYKKEQMTSFGKEKQNIQKNHRFLRRTNSTQIIRNNLFQTKHSQQTVKQSKKVTPKNELLKPEKSEPLFETVRVQLLTPKSYKNLKSNTLEHLDFQQEARKTLFKTPGLDLKKRSLWRKMFVQRKRHVRNLGENNNREKACKTCCPTGTDINED